MCFDGRTPLLIPKTTHNTETGAEMCVSGCGSTTNAAGYSIDGTEDRFNSLNGLEKTRCNDSISLFVNYTQHRQKLGCKVKIPAYQSKGFLKVATQKTFLRCIAVLIIFGLSVSLIGISPQPAEACDAAQAICTGAYAAASGHCAKSDTSTWECIGAMAAATAACAAAWLLCGSS